MHTSHPGGVRHAVCAALCCASTVLVFKYLHRPCRSAHRSHSGLLLAVPGRLPLAVPGRLPLAVPGRLALAVSGLLEAGVTRPRFSSPMARASTSASTAPTRCAALAVLFGSVGDQNRAVAASTREADGTGASGQNEV